MAGERHSQNQARRDTYDAHMAAKRQNQDRGSVELGRTPPIHSMSGFDDDISLAAQSPCLESFEASGDCEEGASSILLLIPTERARRDSAFGQTDKKDDDMVMATPSIRTDAKMRRALILWSILGSLGIMMVVGLVLGTQVA